MLELPKIIAGKYERLEPLGEGGQGKVYRARHVELGTIYALKLMTDEGGDAGSRFRREGWALARLKHPHIVQVFDLGREGDLYYLIMEFVDGPTLKKRLASERRLPLSDALEIARQVAGALAYAHEQPYEDAHGVTRTGMVHRDVKPSNILLRHRGPLHALLADFGLVKLGDGERTTTGAMMGTVPYSAPEQLGLKRGREKVPLEFRADVFAFGLVLYEMLEGRRFHGDLSVQEILARVLYERDELVPEFTQPLPDALKELIARAVHRYPEERQSSMAAVLKELESIIGDRDIRSDDQIEKQIRKLEEQRTRRAAQAAQAARERARVAGAHELVVERFAGAVQQHDDASLAMEGGRLGEARGKYEEVARLYEDLAKEAAAALAAQEADKAQEAMRTARRAAEAAGAAELAPEAFTRARGDEDAGNARKAEGAYKEAAELFVTARRAFQEAAHAAERERQLRPAEAAREEAKQVRTASQRAGTPKYAPDTFRAAEDLMARAEASFRADAFEAAAAGFRDAKALLEKADAEAAAERVRQDEARKRTEAARARAEAARAEAEAAEAPEHASEAHARAAATLRTAERKLQAGEYDEAGRVFEAAAGMFAGARRHSLWVRAVAAETEARRGLAEIEAAGAVRYAPDPYAQGTALLQEAGAFLAAGENEAARGAFESAAAHFARAAEAAKAVRRREEEEAEARRRVQEEARRRARQAAEEALAQAVAARGAAERADASRYAAELYTEGMAEFAAAEKALTGEAYDAARAGLAQAVSTLRRAAEEAERRGAAQRKEEEAGRRRAEEGARRRERQDVEQALAQAVAAREAAERAEAPRWAGELYAGGVAEIGAAEQALAAGSYEAARTAIASALARFGRASEETERRKAARRREDEEAHRRAEAEAEQRALRPAEEALAKAASARAAAERAQAPRYAGALYQQGLAQIAAAEKALAAKSYDAVRAQGAEAAATLAHASAEAERRRKETDVEPIEPPTIIRRQHEEPPTIIRRQDEQPPTISRRQDEQPPQGRVRRVEKPLPIGLYASGAGLLVVAVIAVVTALA